MATSQIIEQTRVEEPERGRGRILARIWADRRLGLALAREFAKLMSNVRTEAPGTFWRTECGLRPHSVRENGLSAGALGGVG